MNRKFLHLITSPYLIALLLFILLIIFLPPLFSKYNVEIIDKIKTYDNHLDYFEDLNNDGNSEEINVELGYENSISLRVREKGRIIDQWNFDGKFQMQNPFCGDYNNDGYKEVFLITLKDNQILLHAINPETRKIILKNRIIDNFHSKNGVDHISIQKIELVDINNDGLKELVFLITTGFPAYPRKIYSYDINSDILNFFGLGCASLHDYKRFKDDSDNLFLFSTMAVANCSDTNKYSDQSNWLTLINDEFKPIFNPKKINIYPSWLGTSPIQIKNEIFIVALNVYQGTNNSESSLQLYNLNGNLLKERKFEYSDEWYSAKLFSSKNLNKAYIIKHNGNIEKIDHNLNREPYSKIPKLYPSALYELDLDFDGEIEYITHYREQEKVIIIEDNLKDFTEIILPGSNVIKGISLIQKENLDPILYLTFENFAYQILYSKNLLYEIRHLFYLLIYLGILGFILLLQKTQKYRAEQKFKAQKEIAELQMRSIKNQIDPHFTLNIINSIGSLFTKHETEKANYVFGKYSKLLRNTILNSDQIITTLRDELDYVDNYLSLEQIRSKEGFDFKVEVDENVNEEIKFPKMLIHTFVENSIKHGIKHLDKKGNIEIFIKSYNDYYLVSVKDNGIGRIKAKEYSKFSTGKGLEIIDEILALHKKLEKVEINYEIIDLMNSENEVEGTEIKIKIPILKN